MTTYPKRAFIDLEAAGIKAGTACLLVKASDFQWRPCAVGRSCQPACSVLRVYPATANHMLVIAVDGTLVYAGGIDDSQSTDPKKVASSHSFARAAREDLLAGRRVARPSTQPFGCALAYPLLRAPAMTCLRHRACALWTLSRPGSLRS